MLKNKYLIIGISAVIIVFFFSALLYENAKINKLTNPSK